MKKMRHLYKIYLENLQAKISWKIWCRFRVILKRAARHRIFVNKVKTLRIQRNGHSCLKSSWSASPEGTCPVDLVMLFYFIFIYLVCETIGTAATPGLLYQHRVIVKMIVEKQMECRLAGETEVIGENLPQCHF
jgi:hypothetical protein